MSCVSHTFASVPCCLVVTCWERADLFALVGDFYCIFVTFPCGILGQVWHLIVSSPDLCLFSYYNTRTSAISDIIATVDKILRLIVGKFRISISVRWYRYDGQIKGRAFGDKGVGQPTCKD